jgi:hypothetical protein
MKKHLFKTTLLLMLIFYSTISPACPFIGYGWIDIGWIIVTPAEYSIAGDIEMVTKQYKIGADSYSKMASIKSMTASLSEGANMTIMTYACYIQSQTYVKIINQLEVNCLTTWTVGYDVQNNAGADVSISGGPISGGGKDFQYGANFNLLYEYSASSSGSIGVTCYL